MTLKLNGSTDGSVSIDAPADTSPTGTDITLTLPTTVGSANQFVKNGGTAGELEFSSMVEGSSGDIFSRSDALNVGISASGSSDNMALQLNAGASGGRGAQIYMGQGGTRHFTLSSNVNETTVGTTSSTPLKFAVNDGEVARFDTSGRLQIGTTAGTGNLNVAGTGDAAIDLIADSDDNGSNQWPIINFRRHSATGTPVARIYQQESSNSLVFDNNGSERLRIDDSGRFLHGITSPSSSTLKFEVAANVGPDPAFRFNQTATSGISYDMFFTKSGYAPDDSSSRFLSCTDTSATRMLVRADGDVLNHDNSYGSLSDVSLKQQIVDASSQWDDIKGVRVRKFKMNSDVEAYGDEAGFRIGVIAQELEQTSPGLVKNNTELDGTTLKSVSYSVLYMKAIKALQEAQTRIETLETQNTAQQTQIDDLLARVTALEAAE
jgi:hypothetical protein